MARRDPIFSLDATRQFKKLRAYDQRLILDGIRRNLVDADPTEITRNKFRLRRHSDWADYELRLGDLRVFYRVDVSGLITITLIGIKKGSTGHKWRGVRNMKIAPLYEVKNKLSEYVQETSSGPIVITKNGKPFAALVHLEEDQDM